MGLDQHVASGGPPELRGTTGVDEGTGVCSRSGPRSVMYARLVVLLEHSQGKLWVLGDLWGA